MTRVYRCLSNNIVTKENYSIRTVQDSDIEYIRQWRNSQLNVLRQSKPITLDEQKSYYNREIWPSMENLHPKNILLSFFFNDILIGYGGLVHINWENKRAEISFLLDPIYYKEKKQYCEAFSNFLGLLKRIAFDDLSLERLYTETYAIRDYHISILESSGFIREGIMKNHVIINNSFVDSVIHGCLRSYCR